MAIVTMSPFGNADFLSGRTNVVDPCGQEWQSHWIDNWSLLLILEGKGEIELETGCLPVVKQDLVLIAPGYPHKFRCPGPWVLLWVHFLMRPHLCPLPGWTECQPGARCCNLPKREFLRARSALQEACLLDLRRAPNWYLLAYCLLESVVLRGCRVAAENTSNENVWLPLAQQMLLEPVTNDFSMDRIAAGCGMSRTKFYTAFKRLCGLSPRAYRELHQMRRAQLLLENTALPVAEIACQVGIANPFYFTGRFRKFSGSAPYEYRSRLWKGKKQPPSR